MTVRMASAAVSIVLLAHAAHGSAIEEAKSLREEGMVLLSKARSSSDDVITGSKAAIKKFEEAAAKLDGFAEGTREGELRQDLNSLIFWTRRTTPMDFRSYQPPPTPPAEKTKSNPQGASQALAQAEAYAKTHADDPVTVAARFFEIADKYSDLHDIAYKATSRAQHYQSMARQKSELREAEAAYDTLSKDAQLVVDGDRAYRDGNYDEAISKYTAALSKKATPKRNRKMGHARFNRAQQYREEYSQEFIKLWQRYNDAKRRNDQGAMAQAAAERRALKKTADKAIELYEKGESAFSKAWMASSKSDIDSEVHMALCRLIRKERFHRDRAAQILERVLRSYHGQLKTDEERTLYALAQSYAGPKVAERVARQLAAKDASTKDATASNSSEMSDGDLRAAIDELASDLESDQKKLRRKQSVGVFDEELHRTVTDQKKRLAKLQAEAKKRGLDLD